MAILFPQSVNVSKPVPYPCGTGVFMSGKSSKKSQGTQFAETLLTNAVSYAKLIPLSVSSA